MIPKGRCLEEHYHYRQMVSQGGTSSSPVLQKATLRLGTDARMFSDFLLLLQMQGLFPSSSVSRQIIWAIWPLFPTFFPPWNKDSSWVALTRMLWMLLFKILKGQEKRDRVCARTGESRLRRAKEDHCPCLRRAGCMRWWISIPRYCIPQEVRASTALLGNSPFHHLLLHIPYAMSPANALFRDNKCLQPSHGSPLLAFIGRALSCICVFLV